MKEKKCPICYEKVYSGVGKGCKMCGMVLEDKSRDFCSRQCRVKYDKIKFGKPLAMVFVLISLMGLVSADVGDGDYGCGMMSWFYGGMSGIGFFGWIIQILIIVALVLFIVWLVKKIQRGKK
ncbi:MAG: hypothetical protein KJ718_04125 [Nanoarchaeota archaeon]|nr:hypothetical protein [Nanoarchaeota archaeon]MBU1051716.1 hypothetical protein [Nanoarchaeota archaeon]